MRFVFRFWFAYMALYLAVNVLPELPFLPGLQWIGIGTSLAARQSHRLIPWVGHHVLRVAAPMTAFGSDTTYDYVLVLSLLVLATIIAGVWSLVSRAEDRATSSAVLCALVRYGLGVVLVMYGISKITTMQFLAPTPERLLEPYGDSSAQGLLWTFMGYSAPYTIFTGVLEALAGVLLFWRRTTLIGGLFAVICLTNVVALNFAYDVPVKLFSTHLLLMAAFLVAPDARRLLDFLTPPTRNASSKVGLVVKPVLVALLLVLGTVAFVRFKAIAGDGAPTPPIFGIYDVERFTRNGQDVPPLFTDRTRWRRAIVNRFGGFEAYEATGEVMRYRISVDPAAHVVKLTRGSVTATMTYSQSANDELTLQGALDGANLQVKLHQVDIASFQLLKDRFHWISDEPHNR